jgi:3',5'-cyclic AMP phosphodiesterase CpdA
VSARILHVSDLHVGAQEPPSAEPGLTALVARVAPDLIVASGDLTHGGRRSEHARAAALLRSLGPPVLAVPGNHDIPPVSPARFLRPWAAFEAEWETTEPVFSTAQLQVVGLNSVRPGRYQSGGVGETELRTAVEQVAAARPGALRVVVLHHQLVNAPWRNHKRPLARRDRVLDALAGAGAELIVGGHTHQGAVAERREFDTHVTPVGPVVLATAPGLGRPRPRRRGEARGALVYSVDGGALDVETYVWIEDGWSKTAVRRFPRAAR